VKEKWKQSTASSEVYKYSNAALTAIAKSFGSKF